jgi:hypothetical protein
MLGLLRIVAAVAAFILISYHSAAGQVTTPAPQQVDASRLLRVFLDCNACDFDFLRTEIKYIDYVRDRKDADVHVLVTTQRNSSGGEDFLIEFIGAGAIQGQTRTLRYASAGTDTSDARRRGFQRGEGGGMIPVAEKVLRLAVGGAAGGPAELVAVGRDNVAAIEAVGERSAHRFSGTVRVGAAEVEVREARFGRRGA